jgi:SAM-dependent methyltransferase
METFAVETFVNYKTADNIAPKVCLDKNTTCSSAYINDFDYLYDDHIKYTKCIFEKILPFLQKSNIESVLDACCGNGHNAKYFLEHNFNVAMSDLHKEMLSISYANLKEYSSKIIKVFNCDVLNLNDYCDRKYDLVLFRGNTLGHLSQVNQLKALEQLLSVVSKGGFLIFDFRDGKTYFTEKKWFEIRGKGFNRKKLEVFLSFYRINHPLRFSEKYTIKTNTYVLNLKKVTFRKNKSNLEGNYVNGQAIVDFLEKKKLQHFEINIKTKGLQQLKTFMIENE